MTGKSAGRQRGEHEAALARFDRQFVAVLAERELSQPSGSDTTDVEQLAARHGDARYRAADFDLGARDKLHLEIRRRDGRACPDSADSSRFARMGIVCRRSTTPMTDWSGREKAFAFSAEFHRCTWVTGPFRSCWNHLFL